MDGLVFELADEVPSRPLGPSLERFSKLRCYLRPRPSCRPRATICSCDDFDEIAALGESRLGFLRRFWQFHFGIPPQRWLRDLVNRIDPMLCGGCFESWIAALWPDRHDLIAIDGKTSWRTHDKRKGLKAHARRQMLRRRGEITAPIPLVVIASWDRRWGDFDGSNGAAVKSRGGCGAWRLSESR